MTPQTPEDAGSRGETPKPKFWRRQFAAETTQGQNKFDIVFGFVLPIFCFIADPIVFTMGDDLPDHPLGGGLLRYAPFAYTQFTVVTITLAAWMLFRSRLGVWRAPSGGVMLAGAVSAFGIGCILLPISVLGLILVIGVLGFTPFLTGFVLLRNGVRALRAPTDMPKTRSWRTLALIGVVLGLALPWGVQRGAMWFAATSLNDVMRDDVATAERAAGRLKWLWFADVSEVRAAIPELVYEALGPDTAVAQNARDRLRLMHDRAGFGLVELAVLYDRELSPDRKEAISALYKQVTDEDIESALAKIMD